MTEEEQYGMSAHGVEKVEVHMPEQNPHGFFHQLVKDHPALDEKLVFWHFSVNRLRREAGKTEQTIRETVYHMIEFCLNEWLELQVKTQTSNQTTKGVEK